MVHYTVQYIVQYRVQYTVHYTVHYIGHYTVQYMVHYMVHYSAVQCLLADGGLVETVGHHELRQVADDLARGGHLQRR